MSPISHNDVLTMYPASEYGRINAARSKLLAAGLRCIAMDFNGYGDDGSVDGDVLVVSEGFPINVSLKGYDYGVFMRAQHRPDHKGSAWFELINDSDVVYGLQDLAYHVLENFEGDWRNGAGGHGVVAIDLNNLDYHIDGYQRYESEDPADTKGTFVIPGTDLDIVSLIASTLK
jgi:hypothetical protein